MIEPSGGHIYFDGEDVTDVDAGVCEKASLGDRVFFDADRDGIQDAGEPGIPGVSVVITDSAGISQTLTTDANGDYSATVPAGDTDIDIDTDFDGGGGLPEPEYLPRLSRRRHGPAVFPANGRRSGLLARKSYGGAKRRGLTTGCRAGAIARV